MAWWAAGRRGEGLAWRLLVLLHFLSRLGAGGGGEKSEVSERLLSVSEGSLLLPPPRRLLPAPSSSEGSMESWWVQPGLVLPPLLWLRWWRHRLRRLKSPRPRRLRRREAGDSGAAAGPWLPGGGTGHRATGRARARCRESPRLSPVSSSAGCRLPAELLLRLSRDGSLSGRCGARKHSSQQGHGQWARDCLVGFGGALGWDNKPQLQKGEKLHSSLALLGKGAINQPVLQSTSRAACHGDFLLGKEEEKFRYFELISFCFRMNLPLPPEVLHQREGMLCL